MRTRLTHRRRSSAFAISLIVLALSLTTRPVAAGPLLERSLQLAEGITLQVTPTTTEPESRPRHKGKLATSLALLGVGLVGAIGAGDVCDGIVFDSVPGLEGRQCLGDVKKSRAQIASFSGMAAAGALLTWLWK